MLGMKTSAARALSIEVMLRIDTICEALSPLLPGCSLEVGLKIGRMAPMLPQHGSPPARILCVMG